MHEPEIYEKTAAGAQEVKQRVRGLPPRLRAMLIMVDGVRTVGQLDVAAQTLDAPLDYLALLRSQDLVRVRGVVGQRAGAGTEIAAPPAHRGTAVEAAATTDEPYRLPASDAERFRAAQKLMNDCAVDALGLRALFWTLRLEKAATGDDLRQLLADYGKAMTKARGQAAAALLDTRVRSMLG